MFDDSVDSWPRSRNNRDADITTLSATYAHGVSRQTIVAAITGASDATANMGEAAAP